jgi:hypothetical protein
MIEPSKNYASGVLKFAVLYLNSTVGSAVPLFLSWSWRLIVYVGRIALDSLQASLVIPLKISTFFIIAPDVFFSICFVPFNLTDAISEIDQEGAGYQANKSAINILLLSLSHSFVDVTPLKIQYLLTDRVKNGFHFDGIVCTSYKVCWDCT